MNFLQRIFGLRTIEKQSAVASNDHRTVVQIQEETKLLWNLIADTVQYYNSTACPCAFPRFIQYTSIDCLETKNLFYMSETEAFIHAAGPSYTKTEMDKGDEMAKDIWICKACGSKFVHAWSQFSINVDRRYLKPVELKAQQFGADAEQPIPYVVGLFGYSYPDRSGYRQLTLDEFKTYIQTLKELQPKSP